MDSHNTAAEGGAAIAAKLAPPASVSIATFMGMPVSEILVWVTLIYTVVMLGHKLWQIYQEFKPKQ
jgi:hypothetical protein